MKVEYMVREFSNPLGDNQLNAFGQDGWILSTILRSSRRIAAPPDGIWREEACYMYHFWRKKAES